MRQNQTVIEFKNVSLKFKTKIIFKNFNFTVESRQKVVVFGKSGIGKSTLLNLILGFEQPQAGAIFFKGKKITPKNIWWVRSQIAYVDQDVMLGTGLVRTLINEYFSFAANLQLQPSPQKLEKYLRDFELDARLLDKDIDQFSGGERQRLALIVALLLDRPVMILDEATSALDPALKKLVISMLLKNQNKTLLAITHDQEWQHQAGVSVFDFKEKKWVR